MKNFKRAYQIFFCMVLFQAIEAQQNTPAPVKIRTVEGITEYRLNNGLRVLVFPDPSRSSITVNVTYLVGSRMEGYGETGMAHLLEHMMFRGSTHHENIKKELTLHGSWSNGTTWYDRTNYYETLEANDENLKWALDMESDRMVNSFIAKKDLESEFSVVRNEFENGENYPSRILEERVMSTAYLWHNYGKAVIGSKEDIERVPIENLQAFYHKYYQPDNAVVLVTGKIDEAKTVALVNEYFGKIPKPNRVLTEPYTWEPVQDGERVCELKRNGDVQVVSCGYHICNGAHPDFAALDVLQDVLTNVPSGRLYKALVESKKATRLRGSTYALHDPGFIYFSADVLKEKSLDDAKNTLLHVMDSLKYNPITAEEVERGKNKLLKDFDQDYNSSENVGYILSEYIAQGDWRLWFDYRDRVEKVTAQDVNRAVNTYLKPTNRTTGVFIPELNSDRAQIPTNPDIELRLKDYKGKEKLADEVSFDVSPDNIDKHTEKGTLSGGAKYAFLKKPTRGGTVNALITLHIGSIETLKNKDKVISLTANMLMKGTSSKTRQQINDALDKLKAEVNVYGGGQDVVVSIKTVKENFPQTLALIEDILRHPSFPSDEFDKQVQSTLDGLEQSKTNPQSLAFNALSRYTDSYPAGDFRHTMTYTEQIDAVKKVQLSELKQFYTDFYNGASASIVVIGDLDGKNLKDDLGHIFSNWTPVIKFERAPDTYFNSPAKVEKINVPDKTNATMAAKFNLEIRDDNPDYAALELGNFALGGGFLNSRLASRIREKEGISYGVGSWVYASAFDKAGAFGSYAIFNPDNLDKLTTAYKEEVQKVVASGYTGPELEDARKGFLQERKVSRANDDFLVYTLSENLFENRTMQFQKKEEEDINSLSADKVNGVMKKWIAPEKITMVLAGDFERKKETGSK